MKPRAMSRETEDRLHRAVDLVLDQVDHSAEPSAAVAKAAADLGLPPGHLPLLVRAYNVAATEGQRRQGSTLLEKLATVPLADHGRVVKLLYGDGPARRPEAREYNGPPDPALGPSRLEKAAELDRGPYDTAPRPRPAEETQLQAEEEAWRGRVKAAERERQVDILMSQARSLLRKSGQALLDATKELEEACQACRETFPLPAFRKEAADLLGPQAQSALTEVARRRPELDVPGRDRRPAPERRHDPAVEPYRSLHRALSQAERYQLDKAAFDRLATSVEQAQTALRPREPRRRGLGALAQADTESSAAKTAGVWDTALGTSIGQDVVKHVPVVGRTKDELVNKVVGKLTDPQHERKLQAVETQAMLNDLLSSDPVIKAHPPDEVAGLYNRMSQFAPHAMRYQQAAAQALLQRGLQSGGMDPYELESLAKMDGNIARRLRGQAPESE